MPDNELVDVVCFSDLHINSMSGLCPLHINLENGGTYHASEGQRYLWAGYLEIIQEAKRRAVGRRLVCVLGGDVIEIDEKKRGKAMISHNHAEILRMAGDVLDPLLDICQSWYVVRGTGAHVGVGAWGEEKLAEDIGAVRETPEGPFSFWQLRRMFGGWRYDFAHHIKGNTKNAANKLAQDTLNSCARRGEKPPHFVVRAHVHRVFDSGENYRPTIQAITCPCMEGSTEYIYRIGAENEIPEFGALYFADGRVSVLGLEIKPRKWVAG